MADKPTSSGTDALGTPLLTKQHLVDCFATRKFVMHVVAAVNPHIDEIKAEINATKKLIHSQQHELMRLRGAVIAHEQQLRIQAEEIKKLKAKQDTEERNEKQKILVVNGLEKENPTDHFIKTIKENLNIELKNTEFSLATKELRKRTKKNNLMLSLHFFHISSKNIYASVPSVCRKPGFLITMIQLSLIYQATISFTLEKQAVNVDA